jgi:hypothetical protein
MDLPREMASDTLSILDHAVTAIKGVSRVMIKFKTIVVDCCPSLAIEADGLQDKSTKILDAAVTANQSPDNTKVALAVALDISKMMSSAAFSTSWFQEGAVKSRDIDGVGSLTIEDKQVSGEEKFKAQSLLIEKLQENLASSYRLLKATLKSVDENYTDLTKGLATVEDVCTELNNFREKVLP